MTNQKSQRGALGALVPPAGAAAQLGLALAAMSLMLGAHLDRSFGPGAIWAAPKEAPKLTGTLVAWISTQSEGIVQEMEAIVKHQVEARQFSAVLYLRYLNLYEKLQVIASKSHVDKFAWVARKVRVYRLVERSIYSMLKTYLQSLDTKMADLEASEPRGKQVPVSNEWVTIYETMSYIARHAPRGTALSAEANEMLVKSPTGAADKKRATRYLLFRRAFH